MIKEVNKAFADIVSANSYFSDWSPKGTRVFTNEQDKVRREIDANDCNQLIEASRQMKTRYEDRVSNILAGIKPSL